MGIDRPACHLALVGLTVYPSDHPRPRDVTQPLESTLGNQSVQLNRDVLSMIPRHRPVSDCFGLEVVQIVFDMLADTLPRMGSDV